MIAAAPTGTLLGCEFALRVRAEERLERAPEVACVLELLRSKPFVNRLWKLQDDRIGGTLVLPESVRPTVEAARRLRFAGQASEWNFELRFRTIDGQTTRVEFLSFVALKGPYWALAREAPPGFEVGVEWAKGVLNELVGEIVQECLYRVSR